MLDIDVVYLYENVAREMDVACAVTALLRQRHGVSVRIVQWPQTVPTLYGRVKPRVVVLPFCYTEHSFDCLLEWRQSAFVNLSWEQFFYPGNVKFKTPAGEFAVKHVLHHAWSEDYAEFARRQAIPDDRVFVNGQPAYKLYDEPYRRYFAQRADLAGRYGLNPAKRWIFFPENYNWAFYSSKTVEVFVQRGLEPDEFAEMREFCTRSFRQMMQWLRRLAEERDVEVIVRPRPATPLGQFCEAVKAVLKEMPTSMHVIKEETVREWILASDVVLSSHSTSLIEAALAGRQAFMVTPFPVPAVLHQVWHPLVQRIEREEDLLDATRSSDTTPGSPQLESWARSRLMSHGDAIENLAAYLAGVVTGRISRPPVPSRLCATAQGDRDHVPKWVWFVFRRLRARYRRVVPASADLTRLSEYVAPEEIERRVRRWEALLQPARSGMANITRDDRTTGDRE
jgi:surface carbohydrate biosynthesis protein